MTEWTTDKMFASEGESLPHLDAVSRTKLNRVKVITLTQNHMCTTVIINPRQERDEILCLCYGDTENAASNMAANTNALYWSYNEGRRAAELSVLHRRQMHCCSLDVRRAVKQWRPGSLTHQLHPQITHTSRLPFKRGHPVCRPTNQPLFTELHPLLLQHKIAFLSFWGFFVFQVLLKPESWLHVRTSSSPREEMRTWNDLEGSQRRYCRDELRGVSRPQFLNHHLINITLNSQ